MRDTPTGALLVWTLGAVFSQAVGEMVMAETASDMPAFWLFGSTALLFMKYVLYMVGFAAFATLVIAWAGPGRIEGRMIFRLGLLGFLPAILTAPIALVARYCNAFWGVWVPGLLVLMIWMYALLYKGLRSTAGLSAAWSILVLVLMDGFVWASLGVSFFWSVFQILLRV